MNPAPRVARVLASSAMLLFSALVPLSAQALPFLPQGDPIASKAAVFRLTRHPEPFADPWALAFLPDGRILVTEREGRLILLGPGGRQEVAGLPAVAAAGQGGLLDLALHPRFLENRLLYLSYSAPGRGGASTGLYRARLEEKPGSPPRLAEGRLLWEAPNKSGSSIHFGSRLAFDASGFLFMTTGERGEGKRARDLSEGQGKVLRFREDGAAPPDNPFVGRAGALPEIWSLGHRNPQGLAIHPKEGLPWLSEHGPRGGDEINAVERGKDYGWDLTTYGLAYSGAKVGVGATAPGIEPPLLHWTPSIAPSGLAFYSGRPFPGWEGDLFSGALAGQQLRRVVLEGRRVLEEEILLQGRIGRIRDLRLGPEGFLYLLTDGDRGWLYRLEPAEGAKP